MTFPNQSIRGHPKMLSVCVWLHLRWPFKWINYVPISSCERVAPRPIRGFTSLTPPLRQGCTIVLTTGLITLMSLNMARRSHLKSIYLNPFSLVTSDLRHQHLFFFLLWLFKGWTLHIFAQVEPINKWHRCIIDSGKRCRCDNSWQNVTAANWKHCWSRSRKTRHSPQRRNKGLKIDPTLTFPPSLFASPSSTTRLIFIACFVNMSFIIVIDVRDVNDDSL